MYLSISQCFILGIVTKIILCNERPVIGILTQDIYKSNFRQLKPLSYSYIAASYVKAIEASGGQVIPVFTNKTIEYYEYVKTKFYFLNKKLTIIIN